MRGGLKSGNTEQHLFRIFTFMLYIKNLKNENTQNILVLVFPVDG